MSHANSQAIRHESEEGMPGEDSFLDIVANIVGILIILVMVVGVRASQGRLLPKNESNSAESQVEVTLTSAAGALPMTPLQQPEQPEQPEQTSLTASEINAQVAQEQLANVQRDLSRLQRHLDKSAGQTREMALERFRVEQQRSQLIALKLIQERDLEERRAALDKQQQKQYDVQRALAESQIALKSLAEEQFSLVSQPREVEEIQCVPTPLAKSVSEDSIHVRLRAGRIALIPVDPLMDEVRHGRFGYLREGLSQRGEAADTVGPIDGFRLRCSVVQTRELPLAGSPLISRPKVKTKQRYVFLPVRNDVGVTTAQALLPGSGLQRRLRARRSNTEAVVAWVYPDSYDDLRELKHSLWEAGIPLAVWPLESDDNIVFSSEGVKASAQ